MDLPFSRQQFFDVFERYNLANWPAQAALTLLAIACVVAVFVQRGTERAVGWALALLWAWMAVAYHFAFFAEINPAAWIFGAAFLIAAALFARCAWTGKLTFARPSVPSQLPGILIIAYGLIGYPLVAWSVGHAYPRTPTFGLPCPTTIFTLGMLLLARRPVPASVFVVPLGWSIVGTTAAIELAVTEDYGLLGAAAIVAGVLALRASRRRGRHAAKAQDHGGVS